MIKNSSIHIQDLCKSFKHNVALSHLNIDFEAGLMHGLIGPEAAGKTTLLRLMAGLLVKQSGSIVYKNDGSVITFEELRPQLAYMPERQSLYADLSIKEHLEFFSKLYHLSAEEYEKKSEVLLKITRLDKFIDRPAGQLSGGMYKKLGLMCALLRSPQILLLDEPTNGVDPISRREFWELLYELSEEKILIIVATAYMDEAERCAKAHLLQKGKLLASGLPRELLKQNGVKDFSELFIKKTQNEEGLC